MRDDDALSSQPETPKPLKALLPLFLEPDLNQQFNAQTCGAKLPQTHTRTHVTQVPSFRSSLQALARRHRMR
jgi:hypothetical protein